MLKNISSILLASLLSSLLSACAIAPPDVPVCIELDINRGWCTNTISGTEFYVDDQHPYSPTGDKKDAKTWWDGRTQMLYVPYSSWVEIKKFIIDICKQTNQCTDNVSSWDRTVERVDHKLDQKLP